MCCIGPARLHRLPDAPSAFIEFPADKSHREGLGLKFDCCDVMFYFMDIHYTFTRLLLKICDHPA